mmetsp:Transcript_28215/g.81609  ORF Transcript_28215/g.81609 Transcript_28215/m.81609 type:complete len:128 (+) Transcript_28215:781-1164(+)
MASLVKATTSICDRTRQSGGASHWASSGRARGANTLVRCSDEFSSAGEAARTATANNDDGSNGGDEGEGDEEENDDDDVASRVDRVVRRDLFRRPGLMMPDLIEVGEKRPLAKDDIRRPAGERRAGR